MLLIVLAVSFGCADEEDLLVSEESLPREQVSEEDQASDSHGSDELTGCTDGLALNRVAGASFDDNSCQYTPKACADCDYIVEPDNWIADNEVLKLPPGSVIGIKGANRGPVTIRNFHGTADQPYIIINCDGKVSVSGDVPGIKLHKSSFIRLTGTGSADDYGIKVHNTKPFGVVAELGTTDFEIDHIEITATKGPGISARTRPACDGSTNRGTFVQRNTVIHHNYIHDTGGEGMYVGGSNWHKSFPPLNQCPDLVLYEPELEGVFIYNNLVENTGQDGIQVGGAVGGTEIYNNEIRNYGLKGIEIHQAGIQINPGTTGKIYSNLIKGGTGKGIFLNGFDNSVYNNLIVDCNKDAIHIGDRDPLPNQSYRIVNNTMSNISGYGVITNSSKSVDNVYHNNVLVNVGGEIFKFHKDMDFDVDNNYETSNINELSFKDPASLDYSLLDDSPLIDTGTDNDMEIIGDYMLNTREVGARIDIGAYEYQGQ
ncbi:hypothetical protein C900_01108 [Fulvivirga imtechensis AK7]|uniref:Right handed beta helix domain-containing protein n=1 Tax=Fulvivirga imtechensis AK7 TaxID=1237149 RepID=L8JYK6_9BACT|nr:hypothetical protein C900_01108 [Fulvivirga imtechensis AK7]